LVPDYNPRVPLNANYYVSFVEWFDQTDEYYLDVGSSTQRFEQGHVYTVSISLTVFDGYEFSGGVSVSLNDGKYDPSIRLYDDPTYSFYGTVKISYTFGAAPEKITLVEAGVTPAVVGAYPSYYVVLPDDSNYYLDYSGGTDGLGIYWYDLTENRNVERTEVFQAGHWYAAHILLISGSGYVFEWEVPGKVNGYDSATWMPMENDWVRLSRSWEPVGGITGWYQVDGYWFYNDTADHPVTGEHKIGANYYFFNSSGAMQTGLQYVDGTFKYYDPRTGARARGWTLMESYDGEKKWHYADASGKFVTGWRKIDGKWYYFDYNTVMVTDEQVINGKHYYFNSSGAMVTGWRQFRGSWFYYNENGEMVTGWKKIDGKWYYFSDSGVMCSIGWVTIGGKEYYFKKSGEMAASEYWDGRWLNSDGTQTYPYVAQWKKNSKGWWYGDTSGWYAKNATYKIDGKSYTFDKNGYWIEP
ncbi:MAG: N-acetylmuramoyl-L-alanine amidase family protein, partial [Lachnospiraceae bacterium]|nr:N-acetylmuramoyl-L-alanine amidase family protein [Lachnospiraceae bacterium]